MPIRRAITDNYAFLLAGLLFLFLLIPVLRTIPSMARNGLLMGIALQFGYCLLMLLGVWSLHRETHFFKYGLTLAGLNVVLGVADIVFHGADIDMLNDLVALLFAAGSAVLVVRHVFGATVVDRNLLFGAICVYLLLGLIWAILYRLLLKFWPESFVGIDAIHGDPTMDNLLYYSFVTLAGLGYGDITPVAPLARTLAYMEVVTGQLYIAIMLAGLVSLYLSNRGLH